MKWCCSAALVTGFKIVVGQLLCQIKVLHHQGKIQYSQVTKLESKICPSSNCFDIIPIDERWIRAKQEGRLHLDYRMACIQETWSQQFQFWSIALKMEMDYFLFLWSIRPSNFKLYVTSVGKFLHGSLHSTMYTMLVGCQFITMTWKGWKKRILMFFGSLMLMVTLQWLEPKIDFQQWVWTNATSNWIKMWKLSNLI